MNVLEKKYGVIHGSDGNISAENNGDAIAYVSRSPIDPTQQSLSLCERFYADKDYLVQKTVSSAKNGWIMPCEMNEKELSIYNVTHEYGHMIQNELLKEAFKLNGWDENDPYSFVDFNQTTQEAMLKW